MKRTSDGRFCKEREGFWNCYVEGTSGGIHFNHQTYASAQMEAERLARLPENRGRNVYVMQAITYCQSPETPVEWHQM